MLRIIVLNNIFTFITIVGSGFKNLLTSNKIMHMNEDNFIGNNDEHD